MILSNNDLYKLCETAILAAKQAGKLITEYSTKNISVQNKAGADSLASQVVTEVDIKAQELILEILSQTTIDYDLAILTEESVDDKSRFTKDYFWCIDPMDGTLAFTEKTPGYAVSIGLISKTGEALIGVVYDPSTEILYHAINGLGAYKNEKRWKPDLNCYKKSTFTLNFDRTFRAHPKYEKIINEFEKMIGELGMTKLEIQQKAGAVLNACWVLDNTPGCYFKLPKLLPGGGSLWDFAATACIVKESGGSATDFFGKPLDLNRPDSTFMNHRGVLFTSNKEIGVRIQNLDAFRNKF